jgi:hypothetical protein
LQTFSVPRTSAFPSGFTLTLRCSIRYSRWRSSVVMASKGWGTMAEYRDTTASASAFTAHRRFRLALTPSTGPTPDSPRKPGSLGSLGSPGLSTKDVPHPRACYASLEVGSRFAHASTQPGAPLIGPVNSLGTQPFATDAQPARALSGETCHSAGAPIPACLLECPRDDRQGSGTSPHNPYRVFFSVAALRPHPSG